MDALLNAIGVVLPVVIVLSLGNLFASFRDFKQSAKGLSSLVYWVCLPALVFRDVARTDLSKIFDARLCLGVAGVMFFVGVLGYRYARWRKARPNQVGVIAQAAFRCNILYVGLPILLFHTAAIYGNFKDDALKQASALAAAALAAAIPVLNIGTIFFFALSRRKEHGQSLGFWRLSKPVLTNPLIIALVLGLPLAAYSELRGWLLPNTILGRTIELAGSAALPMALFAIGAVLDVGRAWSNWRSTLPVACIKLLLMPALGLALLWHLGLREIPLAVGIIFLACPTAAASHPMALELGGDDVLAGDMVAITTLICPFTMVFWLTILQQMR